MDIASSGPSCSDIDVDQFQEEIHCVTVQDEENQNDINYGGDDIKVAIDNINKCSEAMRLEIELSNMIQEIYLPKSNNLFDTEDTVLSLASSNTTNAIFFCCILSIGKTNPVHVAKYFEDGAFVGFYSSGVHSQLKQ